ncbi:CbbQ/NirQ/NorQ/GpvN family protein [Prosthecomicrobium hirschii]|uniref:CbbQ/NirQ/NorQ/GpvN family protein n=1 Tax=Prosthecodimorpha hirschii TaxID=665126 RepID=UPI0009F8E72F|nr:CbbQ/NirQ/NorQ/GpvN family protein [Prosthecomicrobium hirschii]
MNAPLLFQNAKAAPAGAATDPAGGETPTIPYYRPIGTECALFERAFRLRLPLLMKGPTGCGKTRFVAHMAARLGLPLDTVACHDDLSAADLTGRFLLKGGETVWTDGPLTRAVRRGGIAYLDEIVEVRKDVTVVLHPLTDDRRLLPLERTGETLAAPDDFMLVVSYNPGYQNLLKSLKPSTRQRFLSIAFDYPPPAAEAEIVAAESGLDLDRCRRLVALGGRLRALKGQDLEEGCSTRLLVYCAMLVRDGARLEDAIEAALIEPLSDDEDVKQGLRDLVVAVFG